MKKINSSKTSSMPMLELIIIIGIFAISSIFILQMFLTANTVEQKAKDKSKGILVAENIAETIKAGNHFQETMENMGFFDAAGMVVENTDGSYNITSTISQVSGEEIEQKEADSYIKFYDKNWQETDTEGTYCAFIVPSYSQSDNGIMVQVELYVYRISPYVLFGSQESQKSNEELCHLHFSDYVSESDE